MEDNRLPKQLLFGRLDTPRKGGRPRLRWNDCVMEDLQCAKIPLDQWYDLALQGALWKRTVQRGLAEWQQEQAEIV